MHHPFKKHILLPICLLLALPAQAEPISLEAGLGAVSLPGIEITQQLRAAYQLPIAGQQIDAVLGITSSPLFLGGIDQVMLTGRYNFGKAEGWQPFVLAGAGWMPLRRGEFGFQLGGGVNQWFSKGFGLSWNASLSLPPANVSLMMINADLSLKWSWELFSNKK